MLHSPYRDGIGSLDRYAKARLQRCASSIIVRTPWGVARRVAPVVVVGAVIVVARAVVARRVAPVVVVGAVIDAMSPVVVMIAVVVVSLLLCRTVH